MLFAEDMRLTASYCSTPAFQCCTVSWLVCYVYCTELTINLSAHSVRLTRLLDF